MPDIFISYCEEDGQIAHQIAQELQAAGYSTWHYEKDGLPGTDYIETIGEVIDSAKAYIVIISPKSIQSPQVYRELVRASEKEKPLFPLLHGLKHEEFQARSQKWRQVLGPTTSINIPKANVQEIMPRLLAGLQKNSILPSGTQGAKSVPPVPHSTPKRRVVPAWAFVLAAVVVIAIVVGIALSLTHHAANVIQSGLTQTVTPTSAAGGLSTPSPTSTTTQPINLHVAQLQLLPATSARYISWSPDGSKIAIGTYNIQFLDAKTYHEVYRIDSVQWPNGLDFSPDGNALAYADNEVTFIKIGTWGDLGTLSGSNDTQALAYSPDGKTLATAIGSVVKLWDLSSGKDIRTFPGTYGDALAFSPDGNILAVPGGIGGPDIKLWNVETGEEMATLEGQMPVEALDFSPDGRILASGYFDQSIRLWDVAAGRRLMVLNGHTDEVTSVAFSPDGRLLASASRDLTVKLWDVSTGKELQSLLGHTDWVGCVAFSPDGKLLASSSVDGVRLWTIKLD